jgi:hypothetical protein
MPIHILPLFFCPNNINPVGLSSDASGALKKTLFWKENNTCWYCTETIQAQVIFTIRIKTFMEYNSVRNQLVMREYGRYLQRMVENVMNIEDPQKRHEQARVIIELMGFFNPQLKNLEDYRHKLWDHLFFISDFKLEVESPYPIPQKETYKSKPDPLPYPGKYIRHTHLGHNLESVIKKAVKEEDAEKKEGYANSIAYYMKLAYTNWHQEAVSDESIRTELYDITDGKLDFTNNTDAWQFKAGDSSGDSKNSIHAPAKQSSKGGGARNFKQGGGGGRFAKQGGGNRYSSNRGGGGRSQGGGNRYGGGGGNYGGGNYGGGGSSYYKKRY